jgi:hypothetical protein
MFTVDINFDKTVITILDETAQVNDLTVEILDDAVYFCQDDNMLQITPEMFDELLAAFNSPDGAFITRSLS